MRVDVAFLRELAAVAAAQTLPRFRRATAVTNKLEVGFDPVTEADREAEVAMRALIAEHFPDHGILGEEMGSHNSDRRHVWVVDPIDGTRAFISGLPVWGTLAGLLEDGKAVVGMMAQPFTRELFYAAGEGAFLEGPETCRRLQVSSTKKLGSASLFTTSPHLLKGEAQEIFERLQSVTQFTRYGCDCYAFAMLAAGHIDLVVESGLHSHDIVGLIPLIEQAGGIVTRWDGGPAETGGDIIAAASESLWSEAIEVMRFSGAG